MTVGDNWLLAIDLLAGLGGLAAAAVILRTLVDHLRNRAERPAPEPAGREEPDPCTPP